MSGWMTLAFIAGCVLSNVLVTVGFYRLMMRNLAGRVVPEGYRSVGTVHYEMNARPKAPWRASPELLAVSLAPVTGVTALSVHRVEHLPKGTESDVFCGLGWSFGSLAIALILIALSRARVQ